MNVKKLLILNPVEWRYLCLSLVLLPFYSHRLLRGSLRITAAGELQDNGIKESWATEEQISRACQIARVVNRAAARDPDKYGCLVRSLLLARFLAREGIPCALKLGANKGDNQVMTAFAAHAWVECGGVVVNDTLANISGFLPFPGMFRWEKQ